MPFIGDLPSDHEIFASGNAVRSGDDYLQDQLEQEDNDSLLRVDSPGSDQSGSDNEEDIDAFAADMLNDVEENGGHEEEEQQAPVSAKRRGRPSKTPVSPSKKNPKSAVKAAGRGRPRGGGVPKAPAKTPTKGARASARVQEIAERPAPYEEEAAPAKKIAGQKRGRPAGSGANFAKKARSSKEPEFEVEKIIDSMIDGDSFEHMYLVKWKGFSSKDNTWEPKENLSGCLHMVYQFDKEHQKTQAKAAAQENKKAKADLAAARTKAKAEREAQKAKAAAEPRKTPGKRGRKPKSEMPVRGRPKRT